MKYVLNKYVLWGVPALLAVFLAFKMALAITAFVPADQPVGYVAQDEMTNYNLRSKKEFLFRGQYEREFWSGGLLAYPADEAGNVDTVARLWDAAENMDLQDHSSARFVATMKDNGVAVAFRLANLSAAQQSMLDNSEALVNFLRGDRSGEGGAFRTRSHVLGDVIHSRPYYVKDATNPTVFVGANDGMLHAINASTPYAGDGFGGQERWAYVPSMLMPKLKKLAVSPYVHDYFVDGQINIATILSGTKRILVGGLGAGGKGLYALNITGSTGLAATNESEVASKVMWEVAPTKLSYANPTTTNAYVNLGYTFGTPTLAKVAGVNAVIVGNGYNDGLGDYSGCTHATLANYTNCGGDYAAYLYVINADTGQLIMAIKAGSNGTAASPNGLSTPAAIDSDGNGSVDTVYAGDLNGTMWKFDLTASPATANALMVTSPAQAITSTPGVAVHPNGGFMVTFGTGKMLAAGDLTDTAVHYAYGVWDTALPNAAILTQTLTERSFTVSGVTSRVRRVTSNQPNWASGAANHKGWKVALPAGEKVLGEGSFIENGRFYFTSHNPTVSTTIPNTTTVVKGENWLMELDFLSGGTKNEPFLDLSGDVKLDNTDRIKYLATDTIPVTVPPTAVGDPILTTDGISVGKFIAIGVMSQPILVQLVSLNDTLFNQNPDVTIPPVTLGQGVDGGHFDADIFYGSSTTGARATATITVGSTGQTANFPATLGTISVNGVMIVPSLTVNDLPNGTSNDTNASTIRGKVTNGFSASRSGNVITVTAPLGAEYNGKTFTIADGTSQTLVYPVAAVARVDEVVGVTAVRPTGFITFSGTNSGTGDFRVNDTLSSSQSVRVGGSNVYADEIVIGSGKNATQAAAAVVAAIGTGGTYKAYVGGNAITALCAAKTANVVCIVDTSSNDNAGNNGRTVSAGDPKNSTGTTNITWTTTSTSGGVTGVTAVAAVVGSAEILRSGWTNFKPALTTTAFSGGVDAVVSGDGCTGGLGSTCQYKNHIHQYDDKYDRTGVNFLNASNTAQNLINMIPTASTQFKVLAMNQYLSPAVKLHIGNAAYLFDVDSGYISVKNFMTSATLDLAAVPTYVRGGSPAAPVIPIGSFAINMPVDALTSSNWWGNGDVRVGLHPTTYACVWASSGSRDGNMYQPVIPPANGTDGPGARGWFAASGSTPATTPATATGARHNGALTFQLIKADTPNTAIEQNIPGRPEYGWRVKSASFSTYVLGEYSVYWHHPNELCYHSTGWTKTPGPDTSSTASAARAAGSTDPKIGDLGVGAGSITDVTTTVVGDVTTTVFTYSSGLTARIVRTANRDASGNLDGSVTIVTRDTTCMRDSTCPGVTQIIANSDGKVKSGGDESGLSVRTGRISWRELVAP